MHRAALTLGDSCGAPGQLRHNRLWIHARGEHVTVIAIAGDDLISWLLDGLHAHGDGFLPDVEVAEAADQTHAVELARPLLKATDQQHQAVVI